jgi:hypothetical protein
MAGEEKRETVRAAHRRSAGERPEHASSLTAAHALHLQRIAGNRAVAGLIQRYYTDDSIVSGEAAVKEKEEEKPPPPPAVVDPREEQYKQWLEEAKTRPMAFQQGDVWMTTLSPEHQAAELKQEKVVRGDKVIGPKAYWRPKGTPLHDAPVRYLSAEERAAYELQLKKDERRFYWQGKLYSTKDASQWSASQNVQGRAIFVMTTDRRLYVADQATESTRKSSQEGWLFHHSSFLGGEPVAAAGELVFEDGCLKGITDGSGHYRPELKHMRQVLQLFRDAGVDLRDVTMVLVKKKDFAEELEVPATLILELPDANEFEVRQEVKRRAREKAEQDARKEIGRAQAKEDYDEAGRLYEDAVNRELIPPEEPAALFTQKGLKAWAARFLDLVWQAKKTYDAGQAAVLAYHAAGNDAEAFGIFGRMQGTFYSEYARLMALQKVLNG